MNELTGRSPSESPVPDPPSTRGRQKPTSITVFACCWAGIPTRVDGGPTVERFPPPIDLARRDVRLLRGIPIPAGVSGSRRSRPPGRTGASRAGHDGRCGSTRLDSAVAPLLGAPDGSPTSARPLNGFWSRGGRSSISEPMSAISPCWPPQGWTEGHVIAFEPGQSQLWTHSSCRRSLTSSTMSESIRSRSVTSLEPDLRTFRWHQCPGTPNRQGTTSKCRRTAPTRPSMRLDDIHLESRVDLIKIDIEGGRCERSKEG